MADHSKPGLTDTYSNWPTLLDGRFDDLAVMLDPARVTPTNLPTYAVRWNSASSKFEVYNGSAWSDLATTYAIAISGNADTATTLAATLAANKGGTGQSSYTVGDLLYASSSSALSKLADVATGNVLISGGVGAAPAWGKVALATHVNGTLPVANGGSGATTLTGIIMGNGTSAFTAAVAGTDYVTPSGSITGDAGSVDGKSFGTFTAAGGVLYATSTSAAAANAAGTAGQVLISAGAGAPAWGTDQLGVSTNSNALSGYKGQYVEAPLAEASAISLTTGTPASLTSITLAAGDWDVSGVVAFAPTSATLTSQIGCFSTASATLADLPERGQINASITTTSTKSAIPIPTLRFSVSATTVVYLVAQAAFSAGSCKAFGRISARRVR